MEFIYKNLSAQLERVTVTDEEIDRQLQRLRQQSPCVKIITDRPSQNGDELVLDYAGFADGKQFDGGTAEKQTLTLGSGMFIPGFEEQLVGKNAGDEVTVHVTFPAEYHAAELAGKKAEFHCKIHEIRVKGDYASDDAFAKAVGECNNYDEMRMKMAESLRAYYDERSEMEVQDRLIRQAAATLDYTPAADELEKAIDAQLETMQAQLSQRGLSLEAYCQFTGSDMKTLREDARADAENSLRVQKTAERIAELENIAVDDKDIAGELAAICRQNHMTMEQLRPYYDQAFEEAVVRNLRMKKAIALVRENANVTEVAAKEPKRL